MAPKPEFNLFNKATGRSYRLSADGREYVFENGDRVAVPPAQRATREAQPASRRERRPSERNEAGSSRSAAIAIKKPREQDAASAMGKLSLSASTASPGHSSNPGALSEITAWEGGDPQTGIHSMWQFSPRQQQPKSKTQPPRSFNPKFIRSNGSTVAEEVDEDEDGEDEDEEGDAGGAAPDPTNRDFEGYSRSENPKEDFVRFRVVEILFIPPPTSRLTAITGAPPQSESNDEPVTRMRRFVIIGSGNREDVGTFKALPIKTYNGRGVGVPGIVKSHHTIIYSSKNAPRPMESELPRRLSKTQVEPGMLRNSIRVKPYDRETALDPKSRLDFFDLYEFDYNHYFKFFGTVHKDSRPSLLPQYQAVCADLELSTLQPSPPSARHIQSYDPLRSSPSSSRAADSSQATMSSARAAVGAKLKELRDFAAAKGLTPPTITPDELNQYARDETAYFNWVKRVKEEFEQEMALAKADADDDETDEGDDDDNEDDSDDSDDN